MPLIPVFEKISEHFSLAVLGRQPPFPASHNSAKARATVLGADAAKICLVQPPSGQGGRGFCLLQIADYQNPILAEGVRLSEQKSAAVIQSADCPIVVLHDKATGNLVVFHAGRAALSPATSACSSCTSSVIENAVHMLVGNGPTEQIEALVVASICGTCFKHERKGAEALISPFDQFGKGVFTNRKLGALDLHKVITARLTFLGVPEENIVRASHCTFEHPRMASYRLGHSSRNTVVVVRH